MTAHNNDQWRVAMREWREHWRLGLAALIGTGMCLSVWPSVSSLFVAPLQEAFGWSRGDISLAQNASLAAALIAPVLGRLVDRVGVRPVLIGGLLLTACAYFSLALMHGPLPLYYLLYGLLSVVGAATTGLTFTRVVTGAFVGSRGLALAITRSGLALSGALLPPAVFAIIATYGWRMGFVALGTLILLIALPTAWLWIRGASVAPTSAPAGAKAQISLWGLLKNHKVVLVCVASALNYAPIVALLSQFQPLLVGKGLEAASAAALIGVVGVSALIGAFVTGMLVDRIWAPLVACIFTLGPAAGCLLLLPESLEPWVAIVALILLGLGQGAEIDVVAFMIARYFGMRSYASIYGISVFCIAVMIAIQGSLIGLSYDYFGNYNVALMVAAGCFVLAALSYLGMGRYPTGDQVSAAAIDTQVSSSASAAPSK
ncbi:MFS transporter [Pseudomonas sp. NPDC089392]|uniref:MFS transporter n=1 Tax=Pseudomonas sp. NPDC089392 TaxID=3364459 RepID=UPI0037F190B2